MASRQPLPPDTRFRAFREFARTEAFAGVLLMAFAAVALIWANIPTLAEAYNSLFTLDKEAAWFKVAIPLSDDGTGAMKVKPMILWINDGLMALFFFLVGLEIKREVLAGELNEPRRASLAIFAAIGGMLVPAAFYYFTAANAIGGAEAAGMVGQQLTDIAYSVNGWGIPMATDIAFALGIIALVGSRAPVVLKVFLTAVAIVDDLGAVMVIALFYTAKLNVVALVIGLAVLAILWVMSNKIDLPIIAYLLLGLVVWYAFLVSGVHATIAGVLVAMTVPMRTLANGKSMLYTMEHGLHSWVAYLILPIFALANAGVALGGGIDMGSPVTMGIILGLMVGKPIGVMVMSWIAVKTGIAALPVGVGWIQIFGVAILTGVGFTMSLFIASLAFTEVPGYVDEAKIGILAASIGMGLIGYLVLRIASPAPGVAPVAAT